MKTNKIIITLALLTLIVILLPNAESQYNYEYKNVTSRVNVTNAYPTILEVIVDQDITLNAGGYKTVMCNATIQDWNGWDDIDTVNATLFHNTSTHESIDNGNTHYTNGSCLYTGNDGEYISYYDCTFDVIHYANSGNWICNVTAKDFYGFTDDLYNTTTINELYALNVTDIIDYGDLAVTDTSLEISANITNFGNVDINVSVLGYGAVEGDGYGLMCERGGNIGVEHQRFSSITTLWEDKRPLAATNQDMGLTILQATDLTAPTTWQTFWQLYVPPNPQGECTGTLRFTATTSS
jgi:hypothetical protein